MQKNAETEIDELASLEVMDDDGDDESSLAVYEIGYHLLPNLSEDAVTAAVKDIATLLEKNAATPIGDRVPSKIRLAYTITKRVNAKILHFNEAYFGWVAFEMSREAITRVKEALDAYSAILRYLIVRTSRDAVAVTLSGAVATLVQAPQGDIGKPKREAEAGGEVSEVALDEALKTIATEDAKTAE
ncbi:30S ribosomal protein S6 [Candidatus Kaiserbacteria bacterium]|nr:30S ribosomal protein S6 [Candidatus Kaiserbacteria bacterium]